MGNIGDTFEDRILNAILTAIDNIITPRIELADRPRKTLSGQNVASVMGNLERGEPVEITASFDTLSERNNIFHESGVNDETRRNAPDEVSDLSVSGTHFDRQSRTHDSPEEGFVHQFVEMFLADNFNCGSFSWLYLFKFF